MDLIISTRELTNQLTFLSFIQSRRFHPILNFEWDWLGLNLMNEYFLLCTLCSKTTFRGYEKFIPGREIIFMIHNLFICILVLNCKSKHMQHLSTHFVDCFRIYIPHCRRHIFIDTVSWFQNQTGINCKDYIKFLPM